MQCATACEECGALRALRELCGAVDSTVNLNADSKVDSTVDSTVGARAARSCGLCGRPKADSKVDSTVDSIVGSTVESAILSARDSTLLR